MDGSEVISGVTGSPDFSTFMIDQERSFSDVDGQDRLVPPGVAPRDP